MSALPIMNGLGNVVDKITNMTGQAAVTMKQIGNMGTQLDQIAKIVGLVRNGGNPMELITTFAQSNPQAQQMMQSLNGKSESELKSYAENMAKSYGTDINTVMQKIGLNMPR